VPLFKKRLPELFSALLKIVVAMQHCVNYITHMPATAGHQEESKMNTSQAMAAIKQIHIDYISAVKPAHDSLWGAAFDQAIADGFDALSAKMYADSLTKAA
jgi:hypothetical protein